VLFCWNLFFYRHYNVDIIIYWYVGIQIIVYLYTLIVDTTIAKYPTAKRTDIIQALNTRCKEARDHCKKANVTETDTVNPNAQMNVFNV
jgi:hypothetical protein